jgi:hypothetical protein
MEFDSPHNVWAQFRQSFVAQLAQTSDAQFSEAWRGDTPRTTFYEEYLLPRIAGDLHLRAIGQYWRARRPFDFALGLQRPTGFAPLIWVECENRAYTAHDEVGKLAVVAPALKVLIIPDDRWNDPYWGRPSGGHKRQRLAQWTATLRSLGRSDDPSLLALVVGEWSGPRLRFYSTVLDACGNRVEEDAILLERRLGPNVDDSFILLVPDQGPMTEDYMADICRTTVAGIRYLLTWARTTRAGQRHYAIETDGPLISVHTTSGRRRKTVERYARM